jgi:tagatose-6-phosphate ketose/aldose isomerase
LQTQNNNYPEQNAAGDTATEIKGQPQLWNSILNDFLNASASIEEFLNAAYKETDNIILTGAGTSAFIGLSLQGCFFRNTNIITRAIATTDIVSFPQDYFNSSHTSLLISFARSGDSPESLATVKLADKFSKKCFHLIITCNKNGELLSYHSPNPSCVFVLPEAANDKSLAMTGSYSGMLLSGLLTAYIYKPSEYKQQVDLLIKAARKILDKDAPVLQDTANKNFNRAVFLGSNGLFGTATEAALKLQELTDGQIICKSESYLGFRHGPKAVIDEETLVVYFFSSNSYIHKYEHDLVYAMKKGKQAMFQLGVGEHYDELEELNAHIMFGTDGKKIAEDFLPVCSVVAGQLLAYYKSLQLGLTPDSPSVSGAISRVVEGVNIYPMENDSSDVFPAIE